MKNSGIYTAEQLSLTRADKGYFESDTREELIETIQDIAKSHNIAQVLHWNVLTGKNDELEKLDKEVTFDEREDGMKDLKQGLQETQIEEEKEDNSRI